MVNGNLEKKTMAFHYDGITLITVTYPVKLYGSEWVLGMPLSPPYHSGHNLGNSSFRRPSKGTDERGKTIIQTTRTSNQESFQRRTPTLQLLAASTLVLPLISEHCLLSLSLLLALTCSLYHPNTE